jgi:predicted NBD/HSP70 family sugar kinase
MVLGSLFHHGPLSRAELARATGLTRVTVSDLVAELTAQGLAMDTGSRTAAKVGKPGNLIDINSDGWIIAAIDLSDIKTARGALLTLRGKVLARRERDTGGATGQAMLDIAEALALDLVADADRIGRAAGAAGEPNPTEAFAADAVAEVDGTGRGVGSGGEAEPARAAADSGGTVVAAGGGDGAGGDSEVFAADAVAEVDGTGRGVGSGGEPNAAPCPAPPRLLGVAVASPGVLTPSGEVVYAKDYQWINRPMATQFSNALDIHTYAANDANLRALAEFTYAGASAEGLLEVSLTDGLGAGILLDGQLLLGPSNAAGEIGHIPAMVGGALCTCGRRGCLETVLNREVLQAASGAGQGPVDDAALARIGTAAAAVLAPIVSAFNLSDLVFADPRGLVDAAVLEAIRAGLAERLLPQIMENLNVRVSVLGADAALLGAGALVLAQKLGLS